MNRRKALEAVLEDLIVENTERCNKLANDKLICERDIERWTYSNYCNYFELKDCLYHINSEKFKAETVLTYLKEKLDSVKKKKNKK